MGSDTRAGQDRLQTYDGAHFGYNAMGQRVSASDTPTGDWTYDYDVNGGLRQVDGDGVRVEYVLDSSGRRVARREDDGPLTWWMYAGLRPIAEFDADLRLRKRFFYGVEGHVPEYMTVYDAAGAEMGRYHFVTNLVGSVVGVLDDDGVWVGRTSYSPYGRPDVIIAAPEALRHPFGFAGGIKDDATGLVRFGARDYDPFTGVWLAKDPIGFAGGDANLYGYVGNDPVRFFDPSGLQSYSKDWAFFTGLNRFGAGISPHTLNSITAVTEPFGKAAALFLVEEVAMNWATGGAFTLGKWALKGVRKLAQARKATKAKCATEAQLDVLRQLQGRAQNLARSGELIGQSATKVRTIGTGRLRGFTSTDTNVPGGIDRARSLFRTLTGRSVSGTSDRFVKDGLELVYRRAGKSGHSKLEIISLGAKTREKITFLP